MDKTEPTEPTEEELAKTLLSAVVEKTPRPEHAISPAQPPAYDVSLVNEAAVHNATRNVQNASRTPGQNRPVIAGYGVRQQRNPNEPTRPLKSIPGHRSGVFIPNPDKEINDNTKTSHH